MKKLLLFLSAIVLSLPGFAQTFQYNGLIYTVLSEADKTCRVSWNDGISGDIIIPGKVTYGGSAYSVTSIRSDAFLGCKSLSTVSIPHSVDTIGAKAFGGCDGLKTITISLKFKNELKDIFYDVDLSKIKITYI